MTGYDIYNVIYICITNNNSPDNPNIYILRDNRLLYFIDGGMLSYLEALRLLTDLHAVLLPEFLFTPLVVVHLIGQLTLVLCADEVGPCVLYQAQLTELQLLGGLMMPQQHGALQILLSLPLIQLLQGDTRRNMDKAREQGPPADQKMPDILSAPFHVKYYENKVI